MDSSAWEGCLMGLAVGDALGYSVDNKTWARIQETYGPNGLLGYDLQEDYAAVTSYTQIAAYVCNGLLLSVGKRKPESYLPFVSLGLKEWARSQQYYRDPERSFCWIAKKDTFRRRHCRDPRMLDTLRMQSFSPVKQPQNSYDTPGAMTEAVAVGLFYSPERMEPQQVGALASQAISLTHGNRQTMLSGVVLAYIITGILQEPDTLLTDQIRQAIAVTEALFPGEEARKLSEYLSEVLDLAANPGLVLQPQMEKFTCLDGRQCLAGAIYASLTCCQDFDRAMITAVNHSGYSAAVGAMTGAILGAHLGIDALPDFYLESIECRDSLKVLAEDMQCSAPAAGLFDDDWDQKYVQGQPL